jgi:hypothetical protein
MATPRELLNAIKLRAYALTFASEGKVSFAQAKRQAAQEVAKQERDKRSLAVQQSSTAAPSDGITVSNARRALLARLSEIGSRLKATAGLQDTPSPKPQIRKHVQDPESFRRDAGNVPAPAAPNFRAVRKLEPEQPPTSPVLVYVTNSTAVRIDDREYAPRFHDHVTDNWRKSIEQNAQIQREKQQRSRYIG